MNHHQAISRHNKLFNNNMSNGRKQHSLEDRFRESLLFIADSSPALKVVAAMQGLRGPIWVNAGTTHVCLNRDTS